MVNIDVPQYWDISKVGNLTASEKEYELKLHENVLYFQLR